jgi:hypothetical protein
MTRTAWRVAGTGLVAGGIALVLLAAGSGPEVIEALGAGLGIFGAAIILRTIGAGRP